MGRQVSRELEFVTCAGVLLRVTAIIVGWLMVFTVVFLGYLTVPLLVLTLFLLAWTAFDVRSAIRRQAAKRRKAKT